MSVVGAAILFISLPDEVINHQVKQQSDKTSVASGGEVTSPCQELISHHQEGKRKIKMKEQTKTGKRIHLFIEYVCDFASQV